ncbi:MAG: Rieske (2Fe-2S) protein [Ignavibacteria bacterium]|nr:Rieske (2Fe-2S) protein [Ignavibacteria bacterium]
MIFENDTKDFIQVCSVTDLIANRGKKFTIGESEIAIFLIEGQIHAVTNICPHQHVSVMHDAFVEGQELICPAHGWQFNCRSGKKPDGGKGLDVHETEIRDGFVFVRLHEKKFRF